MSSKPISTQKVVTTSFLVDVSDLVLNIAVAIITGSAVMLSEALQGGADLLTSGLLLLGVKQSGRRANRLYRFGYGRALFFWTLMGGVVTFALTATLSVYFGLQHLLHPHPLVKTNWALVVLIIGLLSNSYALWLSLKRLRQSGRATGWRRVYLSTLIETKATLVLDLMGTAAAASGLVALGIYTLTGDARFDGAGAIVIGVTTGILAIVLVNEVKGFLIGRGTDAVTEGEIRGIAESVLGVKKVLDLKTMFIGSDRMLVNMEVHLKHGLKTHQIEALMDEIKAKIKAAIPSVQHIQVELETPTKK